MGALSSCPSCHAPLPAGAFMCPKCELVVDGAQAEENPLPPRESSIVFTLLAPADAQLQKKPGPPPPPPGAVEMEDGGEEGEVELRPTVGFAQKPSGTSVPTVIGKLDPNRYTLTTFEAFVVSLCDGNSTVEHIGHAAGLKTVEIQAVLHSLERRGVLKLAEARPALARPPAPAPQAPGGDPIQVQAKAATGRIPRAAVVPAPSAPQAPAKAGTAEGPEQGAEASLQEAIALEKRGNLRGAIHALARAIEHSSQPAPLYNRLALVVIKERRDFAMAESLLKKAVGLDPSKEVYAKNLQFAARLARANPSSRSGSLPRPSKP